MKISVVLAEEHLILREGLRALLKAERDVDVIAETGSGLEALDLVERLSPNVVLLDVDIPGMHSVDAVRSITATHPSTKVVVLSLHSTARCVHEALEAGAAGYVGNDCNFSQLAAAIRAVAGGNQYLSPAATKAVVSRYLGQAPRLTSGAFTSLSACQRQVLQLLADGKSTKEIAVALHRSAKTVETHRQQVMQRLNMHTIAELTKYALREGLTNLER